MSEDSSVVLLGRALTAGGLKTGPRLTALALWAHADHDTGRNARPATRTLAAIVGRDERAVRGFLRELEAAGIIAGDVQSGKVTVYRFTCLTPGARDPGSAGPGVAGTRGARDPATPGPAHAAPRVSGSRRPPGPQRPPVRSPAAATSPAAGPTTDLVDTIQAALGPKLQPHRQLHPADLHREADRLAALGWTTITLRRELDRVDLSGARDPRAVAKYRLQELAQAPPSPEALGSHCQHGKAIAVDGTGCARCDLEADPTPPVARTAVPA